MTEEQQRLWHQMLESIDCYTHHKISLDRLVDELEGLFQAGGSWSTSLSEEWYNQWQALEIHRAVKADGIALESAKVEEDVWRMRRFLADRLHH